MIGQIYSKQQSYGEGLHDSTACTLKLQTSPCHGDGEGDITNVLHMQGRVEKGIAAFPDEIPKRLIKLFTFAGETVLDPFLGSGTTTKVARALGRNSYGYEIDLELVDTVKRKLNYIQSSLLGDKVEITVREDARRLRTYLQEQVATQRSVTKKPKKVSIK